MRQIARPKLPMYNVTRKKLLKTFSEMFETVDIVMVVGHAGWGKTTAALQYARQLRVPYSWIRLSETGEQAAGQKQVEQDFSTAVMMSAQDVTQLCKLIRDAEAQSLIVLDDFQRIDAGTHSMIWRAIQDGKAKVMILSRSRLPDFMRREAETTIGIVGPDELQFSRDEIEELLNLHKIVTRRNAILTAAALVDGWPMGWHFLIKTILNQGGEFEPSMIEAARESVYKWFDGEFFKKWNEQERFFLLTAGCFRRLNVQQMERISGIPESRQLLQKFLQVGEFYTHLGADIYEMQCFFMTYLRKKQTEYLSPEVLTEVYRKAAAEFEAVEQYKEALDSLQIIADESEMARVLERICHHGIIQSEIWEYREYIRALPEEKILVSPHLCCGRAVLALTAGNPQLERFWEEKMERLVAAMEHTDPDYVQLQDKLAYLRTAAAHGRKRRFLDAAKNGWILLDHGKLAAINASLTGDRPSIYNGLLDLSWYAACMDVFADRLKDIAEVLYGKNAQACIDLCRAEWLYLQDKHTEAMQYAAKWIPLLEREGITDLLFTVLYLQMQLMLTFGNTTAAHDAAPKLIELVHKEKKEQLMPNIRAAIAWLSLHEGKRQEVDSWLELYAPSDTEEICTLNIYQYIVKLHCYLEQGRQLELIALAEQIRGILEQAGRVIDLCRIEALLAMCYFRHQQKEEAYRYLEKAVELALQHRCPRILEDEGMIMYALVQDYRKEHPVSEQLEHIAEQAKRKGMHYSRYLTVSGVMLTPLTRTEKEVLNLLSSGYTNDEIGMEMGTSPNTVKTHLKNIYAKLQVTNRTEAAHMAQENHII